MWWENYPGAASTSRGGDDEGVVLVEYIAGRVGDVGAYGEILTQSGIACDAPIQVIVVRPAVFVFVVLDSPPDACVRLEVVFQNRDLELVG
jgi:hypothetical protein